MLVIALGLGIAVAVYTWDAAIASNGDGGWFSYAPNTGVVFSPGVGVRPPGSSTDIVRSGLMWVGGVVAWGAGSFWVLRRRDSDDESAA